MPGLVMYVVFLLAAIATFGECSPVSRQSRSVAENERTIINTLGDMPFFRLLGDPCRGLNGPGTNATISFVNKTTEEVLSGQIQTILDTARTVQWHLNRLAREVDTLTTCDHEDGVSYLNMLPELNRLVLEETHTVEAWRNGTRIISLARRELLYEAYLLLSANYKIMADDWEFGSHCTSDLRKENQLRRGFSLLSDGAQMMMCFMMGDDGTTTSPDRLGP